MLKELCQKFFAYSFYPTNSNDWFKRKGYKGLSTKEQFENFLFLQTMKGAIFYHEFKSITLKRQYIPSGNYQLDSVMIKPKQGLNKPGQGLFFIMFQGRGEYFECRFRDMARLAKATGASVLGFNPKGFHASSGKIKKLSDIVDDGIAVVNFLLQKKVKPHKIIMLGNSLGAGVQEMVCEYFRKSMGFKFRQINSNSFKTLAAVIAYRYRLPIIEKFLSQLMLSVGWEILPGPEFYNTGPYRCYMRRKADRTIFAGAEYHFMVNQQSDYNNCPNGYKETNRWLNQHSQLIYKGTGKKDPHDISLHHFKLQEVGEEGGDDMSVYDFINRYIRESNEYI